MLKFNFNSVLAGRLVLSGLASLAVVLAAASVQAGGPNHSSGGGGSSMGSGKLNSVFSNNNNNKQNDQQKLSVFNSQNSSSNSHSNSGNTLKVTKPGDLIGHDKITLTPKNNVTLSDKNVIGKNILGKGIAAGELNGKNGSKPFVDGKPIGLNNKFKFDSKMDKKDFKDFCKDKCFHDCFHTCPWWYCWNYPTWCPLYYGCGCWYDVPVVEIHEGVDLQLVAVRMLDAGDAEQGPAFRVWVRNNSHVTVAHPFNVLLLVAHDATPAADLPQAGVRVTAIEAGQVLPIDIRLPATANQPGLPMLHVLVDSHREIAEVIENNNGAVLNRADVLPIDAPEPTEGTPVAVQ